MKRKAFDLLASFEQCTGCMACYNACQHDVIQVIADEEGFMRPFLLATECLNCGNCVKACPIIKPILPERFCEPQVFACTHANKHARMQASSGGIFSALAKIMMQRQGVVFGAAFTDKHLVEHIGVEREEDLHVLKKSKYVQSNVGKCLSVAKEHLENGRCVLFSGLPCQIAGLYSYLGNDYDKLYTVDLLCKGAPSPGVFSTFINSIEERYKSAVQAYSFRDKKYGSERATSVVTFSNGKKLVLPLTQTSFGSGFSTELFLRPSCYHCQYRNINRMGDITLGDFWGIGRDFAFYDLKSEGISLVMLNSMKGKALFDVIGSSLLLEKRNIQEAINRNRALNGKNIVNRRRTRFFALYKRRPQLALNLFTIIHRTMVWLRNKIQPVKTSCLKLK